MASYKVENIESVDELLDNKTNEDVGIEPMIFAPDEPRVTINERILEIPDELKTIGVENDNNVERIYFEIPRYFDEVNDLSEFTVYINYLNANQEPNKYHCTDVEVEGENIVFSWLTSQDVYKYRGTVRFIVYAVASDNRKWNSTVAELFVMEGLETEGQIIDNNPDIIDELINLKPQVEEALQRIDEQQNVIDQQQNTIEEQQSTITEQQKGIEDTINNLNTKIENGDFTPEFTIGDVETVEPSVPAEVNQTGTQLDPILNFKIPRGATNVVDNLDGTSVAEAPSQRVVKEAVDNINTEIDQIKDTGVQVADTLPIGSVIGWDSEEEYPTDIYEEVDYNPRQLLINPDFQVNQRGETSYQSGATGKLTIDMWALSQISGMTLTVNDGYVTFTNNNASSLRGAFYQKYEDFDTLKQYILVIKLKDEEPYVINREANQEIDQEIKTGVYARINQTSKLIGVTINDGTSVEIEYINLFEGDIAYPHIKKSYQDDLWDCQGYLQILNVAPSFLYKDWGLSRGSVLSSMISLYRPMVAEPTINIKNPWVYSNDSDTSLTEKVLDFVFSYNKPWLQIRVTKKDGGIFNENNYAWVWGDFITLSCEPL